MEETGFCRQKSSPVKLVLNCPETEIQFDFNNEERQEWRFAWVMSLISPESQFSVTIDRLVDWQIDDRSSHQLLQHAATVYTRSVSQPVVTPVLSLINQCTCGLRHSVHRQGQSIGRARFKSWSAGRFRVRIAGEHALRLISRAGKEGSTVSSIICDRWLILS